MTGVQVAETTRHRRAFNEARQGLAKFKAMTPDAHAAAIIRDAHVLVGKAHDGRTDEVLERDIRNGIYALYDRIGQGNADHAPALRSVRDKVAQLAGDVVVVSESNTVHIHDMWALCERIAELPIAAVSTTPSVDMRAVRP